jgi:hypothetical protein
VHYPHQAPKALTEKYLANNQDGWNVIKSKRYARLVQLGLMPPGLESLQLQTVEQWSLLSKKRPSVSHQTKPSMLSMMWLLMNLLAAQRCLKGITN